ncbi:MAG TPA: DUF481 domain-containing protein [Kiloniellaceae bacterium]|nr:DUF481 domain-containing protein [Kiloniellaceae bacterium]HIP78510.1 DUF481 domain-containing protein [Kiloniellaceae bacterium]
MLKRQLPLTLALIFFAVLGAFAQSTRATENPVPGALLGTVIKSAKGNDIAAFQRALRVTIAAAPEHKRAILRHAVGLRPDWAAELLLTALFDPPLPPPSADAPRLVGTAAATPSPGGQGLAQQAPQPPQETSAEEESPWSGEAELGGIARSGNTENLGVSASAEVIYEAAPWRHILSGSFDYLETRLATEEQAIEAEYQFNYDLTERTFVYGLTHYEDDRFSGFDYEITASAGLGTRVIDEESMTWTLAAGPSVRVFREDDEGATEAVPGARLNSDFVWQISETAKLANETELRFDSDRSELENETSLTLQIVESLAGRFSFTAQYRSPVPEDTDELDTTTKASLVYGF